MPTIEIDELQEELARMHAARALWRTLWVEWEGLGEAEYVARTVEYGQRMQGAEDAYRLACEGMAEAVEVLMQAAMEKEKMIGATVLNPAEEHQ
jgi:hypothetical protein